MAEPRFFAPPAAVTISDLMALTGAEAGNRFDPATVVTGAAALQTARAGDICFVEQAQYLPALATCAAVACFCPPALAAEVPAAIAALATRSPGTAFAIAVARLYPQAMSPQPYFGGAAGPAGHVHPTARLEAGVTVEPGAVVGPEVEIGSDTVIGPNAVIGPSVRIGRDCFVGASVAIIHALIGDRVVVQAGTQIGQDGFGFIPGGAAGHRKVPQIGRVIIQDDVDIGANCCVDRGSNRDTVIGQGTKIDNLVQVAHNVVIGRHCLIAGKVGISGSVTIGDFVAIGGGAGISDHVIIGDGARIAASAGLMRDVPAGARWGGMPAGPMREYFRMMKALERLARPLHKDDPDTGSQAPDRDGEGR